MRILEWELGIDLWELV